MTDTPVFTFGTAAQSPAAHTPVITLARPVVPAAEDRARLKEGVHIERSSRRVRTYFGGKLIADSDHALLVYETKRPPAYWFPLADVRMEYLEASHQASDTIRWHLVVKD